MADSWITGIVFCGLHTCIYVTHTIAICLDSYVIDSYKYWANFDITELVFLHR